MATEAAGRFDPRIYALALTPVAFGTSAFGFTGILEPMAGDLSVTVAAAGQLQTVFAVACAIGGPIVAALTTRVDRTRLLLFVLAALATMNTLAALAPSFSALLGIRVVGGLFCALALPVATSIAVTLADEPDRPKAIAVVLMGYTGAFLLGVPLGTALGDAFGWPAAFWLATAFSLTALAIVAFTAPRGVLPPPSPEGAMRAALSGANPVLMLITLLSFAATFATVSFAGPVVTASSGVSGGSIGAVQVAVGLGSLLGLPLGAAMAVNPSRAIPLLLSAVILGQGLFTLGMLYDFGGVDTALLALTMAFSAAALFALSPVVQTQLAANAGPAATLAFALNGSMLFLGQGVGAAAGGAVIAGVGIAWTGAVGAALGLAGLLLFAVALGRPRAAAPASQP
ncbi:MAG: MFS transporter [Pseudomonadota bacterium]